MYKYQLKKNVGLWLDRHYTVHTNKYRDYWDGPIKVIDEESQRTDNIPQNTTGAGEESE
jgi:hypothetical protein